MSVLTPSKFMLAQDSEVYSETVFSIKMQKSESSILNQAFKQRAYDSSDQTFQM